MKSEPVDLTNLRDMTDGDAEMEKALFEEFINSFQLGIESLNQSLNPDTAEIWRKQAHALKGISMSLGAEKLGELCKTAQDEFETSADDKTELLSSIAQEYKNVKKFLESLS